MLVSNSFTGNLRDTLGFESSYSYFNPIVLRKYAASLLSKDSLHWVGDSTVYPRRIFRFYPQLCSSYFWQDSLSVKVLAEKSISSDEFRYDFGVKFDSLQVDTFAMFRLPCLVRGERGNYFGFYSAAFYQLWCTGRKECSLYFSVCCLRWGEFPIIRTEGYLEEAAQVQMSPLLGFVSDDDCHSSLYDIYCAKKTTCDTCDS